MSVFLVMCEMRAEGVDHSGVLRYFAQFDNCKKAECAWLIDTDQKAGQIRSALIPLIGEDNTMFVAQIQPHWSSYNYAPAEWLRSSTRSW